MITFGKRTQKVFRTGTNPKTEVVRGYYLVLPSGDRHWFTSAVDDCALERICNKYLTEEQYQYWVDFCYGYDVEGNLAWANMDQTDKFI